jgi:epoxyqueuosine reductase QueG
MASSTLEDPAHELKTLARERGADAVGIAPVEAIDDRAPEGYGITDTFHDAETVIVAGVDEGTEGAKKSGSSMVLWDSKISRRSKRDKIRMALNDAIEDEYGYESLRFPKMFKEGGMIPYGSLKVCAEEAGLGWRGINDIVLHPDHGAHLGFTAVITNMPLEVDGPLEHNPCPTQFCKRAYENAGTTPCMSACPVDALDGDINEEGEIESRSYDRQKCMSCAMNTGAQRFAKELVSIINDDDAERRKLKLFSDDFQRTVTSMIRGTGWANCFECQTICPVGNEGAKRAMADGGIDTDNPTAEDVQAVREAVIEGQGESVGDSTRSSNSGTCGCDSCQCGDRS